MTVLLFLGMIGGGVVFMQTNVATPKDIEGVKAEIFLVRSEVQLVRLQSEDALDARMKFVLTEIARLEERRSRGIATGNELESIRDLNREYDRLRQLRYPKPVKADK